MEDTKKIEIMRLIDDARVMICRIGMIRELDDQAYADGYPPTSIKNRLFDIATQLRDLETEIENTVPKSKIKSLIEEVLLKPQTK